MRNLFILGRNPALSLAEIFSVAKRKDVPIAAEFVAGEIACITSDKELAEWMKELGGTVKIGSILDEVRLDDSTDTFDKVFSAENIIKKYISKKEGKVRIGISLYNASGDSQVFTALREKFKKLVLQIKEDLHEAGLGAGYVEMKEDVLSSASVVKNQLISKGVEILLVLKENSLLVGKTQAIQPFREFSFRDFFRPNKDKRSGIMPPKLARLMLNLAEKEKKSVILDPFCGSGTMLQEALLLGFTSVIGKDSSRKAVDDTKENLKWLIDRSPQLKNENIDINVELTEVKNLSKVIRMQSVDAIVTEPYLGPPLHGRPNGKYIQRIHQEVSPLYLTAFTEFSKILKPKGTIVMIFPAFELGGVMHFVDILPKIIASGFQVSPPSTSLTERGSVIYGSKHDYLLREIIRFEKNKES